MIQDGTGRCEAVSDVIVSERAYEHFVNGGKNNLSKSLVGAVVLVEECSGGVEKHFLPPSTKCSYGLSDTSTSDTAS